MPPRCPIRPAGTSQRYARLGHSSVATTQRIYVHQFDAAGRSDDRRNRLSTLYGSDVAAEMAASNVNGVQQTAAVPDDNLVDCRESAALHSRRQALGETSHARGRRFETRRAHPPKGPLGRLSVFSGLCSGSVCVSGCGNNLRACGLSPFCGFTRQAKLYKSPWTGARRGPEEQVADPREETRR